MSQTIEERSTLEEDLDKQKTEAERKYDAARFFSIETINKGPLRKVLRVRISPSPEDDGVAKDYDPKDFGYSVLGYRLHERCKTDIAQFLSDKDLEEI